MLNSIHILNILIIICILITAILAVFFENLLASIIALSITGSFVALELIMLYAPDAAIAEAAIGTVLLPVIFIATLKKVEGEEK